MIKIIAVGGVPASGKTTVFRALCARLSQQPARAFNLRLMRGVDYEAARAVVFGIYDNRTFAGTDALAKNVQPEIAAFLEHAQRTKSWQNYRFFFEGDRLFNQKFFAAMKAAGIAVSIVTLDLPEEIQTARLAARKTRFTPAFLKRQRTKLANIEKEFPATYSTFIGSTEQTEMLVEKLLNF